MIPVNAAARAPQIVEDAEEELKNVPEQDVVADSQVEEEAREVHVEAEPKEEISKADKAKEEESQEDVRADRMLAALTAQPPSEIEETFYATKAAKTSASLSLSLRRALAQEINKVIMFTSAYGREGATEIAFQAARSAALQSSGKVLYIHVSSRVPKFFKEIESKIPIALDDFAKSGGGTVLPFVVLEDSGLVCASFLGGAENINEESLRSLIASLRKGFDFTVVGSDDMLSGGAARAFADLVDGTIVVTEAERTRAPVAKRLKLAIENNGGNVIGAILNRRKYHIPGWIYRMLYGGC